MKKSIQNLDSNKICPVCGEDASNYSVMIAVDRPRYVNFYLHEECYMSGTVLQKIEEFFKERI